MEIKKDILAIINSSVFTEPNRLVLPETLERKQYIAVNKILESIGFKWNKKEKAHLAQEDVSEKFYNLMDTGEWVDEKKEFNFFPTPMDIVKEIMNNVKWKSNNMRILEPSAGTGNIVTLIPKAKHWVTSIEINPENVKKTLENIGKNSNDNENKYEVIRNDFLQYKGTKKFDLILANPPFSKNQGITHFFHMVELLSDDGQIICILPSGYFGESCLSIRKKFNEFIQSNDCEIIDLPENAFKESGTMVSTKLLIFKKTV